MKVYLSFRTECLVRFEQFCSLKMDTVDSDTSALMHACRFWPNNKSRMYLLENTGERKTKHYYTFISTHHLVLA
jgi:hypothetical protein